MRPGRTLERPAYLVDSRPHQWQRPGPPPREPEDRLSELCGDLRHPLWSQCPDHCCPHVRALRLGVPASEGRAAVLLSLLRAASRATSHARTAARDAEGAAADV